MSKIKRNIWYLSKYANISLYGSDSRQASFSKEFAKAGNNVRLITSNSSHLFKGLPKFKSSYLNEYYEGVNVTWVNTIKYSHATSFKRIVSWIWFEFFVIKMAFNKNYEKPDVIICSSLSLLSVFSGCFYKRFFNAKFILEIRDIWPQTLIDLKGVSRAHPFIWLLSKIERLGYKYSDEIIGTMPGLAEHVQNQVGLGYKVSCIPQGVSLDFYSDNEESLPIGFVKRYIPKDKFIVTYTGTFGNANALEYIIDAAKEFEKNGTSDVHFLLVGEGVLKSELIDRAGSVSNISFAPGVKKEHVQHVLALSDLLVASVRDEKIYRYGISLNKFIDYMYAKKPVVCMFSGFPSMINEAGCGEFTPSENVGEFVEAIKKYKGMSAEELRVIGENGRRFLLEQRDFSVLGDKFMRLF